MIVDVRAEGGRLAADAGVAPPVAAPLTLYDGYDAVTDEPAAARTWAGRILAGVAIVAALGWVAAVLAWAATGGADPTLEGRLLLLVALVSGPTLIGVAWLLLLRTSRAEARRFGHVAERMRAEAAALEARVATLSRTLSANGVDLARQLEQLTLLGDAAGDRLLAIGRGLADQVREADGHARTLGEAATSAQAGVGGLLTSLPRARADTEELTRALATTGEVAGSGVDTLAGKLLALAGRGREAELSAGAAAGTLAAHLTDMRRGGDAAAGRLEEVAATLAATVDTLLGRTADTLDEARTGIERQGAAMIAMVAAHQATLDGAARTSADALAARIDGVETAVQRLSTRLAEQHAAGEAMVHDLEAGLARAGAQVDMLHDQGVQRSQTLAASISALGGSADAMTEALRAGEAMATRTIGTTETLLIALDAAAREIDETLPEALARLDARIGQSKAVVVQAKPELLALVTAAESTHDAIEAIAGVIHDQRRTLDQLSASLLDTLTEGRAKADSLGRMMDDTIGRSHRFAEDAAPRLIEALLRVRETAATAADHARATLAGVIPEAAEALGSAADQAFRAAAGDTVRRQIDALAEATDGAVAAATSATERLAEQVRHVAEQTAIVETRLEEARIDREAADRDTLSRRVSLLIEALNSASIDITRVLASDVSDSAWAAYLKGDRGVFTRRAVRLLDAARAREVGRFYDEQPGFRDQVNRYIHDFEAMLRAILAQRDGSPLGITLLSSDMGKLYVALAQAIERLR